MSVRSIIPRKNNENQIICLYFQKNLRLKVEAFLKYYNLTHSWWWDIAIFATIILLLLNFSPFCIPMRFQPCRIKLLRVSKRYSMGKMFWTSPIVKNIGELLEAKPLWSELILKFGKSEEIFSVNQLLFLGLHKKNTIRRLKPTRWILKVKRKVVFSKKLFLIYIFNFTKKIL